MPRRWRVDGLTCHVFNRAAAKLPLFRNPQDYRQFLEILSRTKQEFHPVIRVYGYCVMPNHWHLIIRPHATLDLSQFMQRLTRGHARAFLSEHLDRSGAVYQGRFGCVPIQDGDHLATALLYVDRNPVKARLVGRAEHWLWSSVVGHAGLEDDPLLDRLPTVSFADWLARTNRTDPSHALAELALKRRQPLGDPEWVAGLVGEWSEPRRARGRPRKANREIRTG